MTIYYNYKINSTKEKKDYVVIYLDNKEKINLSVESYFSYWFKKMFKF